MRNLLIILCFFITNTVFAQEILSDLYSNYYLSSKSLTKKQNKSALALPFIDDFSYESNIADD